MFIEVFNLKKDAWHAKMIKWMWGIEFSTFSHICPYFWLGVTSVLIMPIYLVLRGIFWCINGLAKKVKKSIDEREEIIFQKMIQDYLLFPQTFNSYLQLNVDLFYEFLQRLADAGISEDEIDRIDSSRRQFRATKIQEKNLKASEKLRKAKDRMNTISRITTPITKAVIWFGSGFLLYIIALFSIKLYKILKFSVILNVLKNIIFVILLVVAIMLIIFTVSLIIKSIGKFFKLDTDNMHFDILRPFKWFFGGIWFIIKIIGQMIKNNCPAINWE